jgi:NTE family protein
MLRYPPARVSESRPRPGQPARHRRPAARGSARQSQLPALRVRRHAERLRLAGWHGATDTYTKGDISGTWAHSIGNNTLSLAFKAGSNIGGPALPKYDLFQWGGFLQQSGYSTGQLIGGNLQFARMVYYNKLIHQTFFDGVYAGFSLEAGRVGAPLVPGSPTGLLKSMAAFLGIDSPVGPLYLGYGRAAGGSYAFYLFLGKP